MIKTVSLNGFNGFYCSYDLGQFTLITGQVGSGKTSIWQAIQFVLASIASANMASMFEAHYDKSSASNQFGTELVFDNKTTIKRVLEKGKNGISQSFYLDGKKLSNIDEAKALKEINITIPTVEKFLDKSDQKQIEELCEKFGDGAEITKAANDIENMRVKVNDQQDKIKGQRAMLERLEATRGTLPTYTEGGLAVVKKDIEKIAANIKEEEDRLKELSKEQAKELLKKEQEDKEESLRMAAARIAEEKAENDAMAAENARIAAENKQKEEQLKAQQAMMEHIQQGAGAESQPAIKPVIDAWLAETEGIKPCTSCLATISEIITETDKTVVCYSCGAEQIKGAVGVKLKLLKGSILRQNGGGKNE